MTIQSACSAPVVGSQIGAQQLGAQLALSQLRLAGGARTVVPPNPFSLVDLQARRVEYLRVSVTDRCNYRCSYCMPAEGASVVPRLDLLSFDEITTLVRLFVDLGIRKVRLTGGEPLVRRDIVKLVGQIAAIPGVQDLSMTTNGHLLADLAKPLRQAGLQRLNVSIDTLDAQRFATVTRQGSLAAVLRGLQAADAAGFTHTKLNAVVLRGLNDDELVALADFASDRGYILRFIEYMPIGVDNYWGPETFLPIAQVREQLATQWQLTAQDDHGLPGGGPARYWTAVRRDNPARTLRLGLIAAVSEKFCQLCNRVRLSPTGTLRECLSTRGSLSLRDLLRGGQSDTVVRNAIADALLGKVDGHRFDKAQPTLESMSAIGG